MTELQAFRENSYRAVPFLDFLEGLVRLGHAVVLFEGHASALTRVCQDADLLIVDEAMISFLQSDWLSAAEAVMRRPCVLKTKRAAEGFGGAHCSWASKAKSSRRRR